MVQSLIHGKLPDRLVPCGLLCLQVVEINSLELELHTLLSEQMESLLAHRRKSVREQAAHLQQLTREWNADMCKSMHRRIQQIYFSIKGI